jgi:ATP-dependent DNA ligase
MLPRSALVRERGHVAMAVARLRAKRLLDGEIIVCDESGLAVFDLIRAVASAVHCAFGLIELDGKDLRRASIEERKSTPAKLLRGAPASIVLNEHSRMTAQSCIGKPAGSAVRASFRSAWDRRTALGAPHIG